MSNITRERDDLTTGNLFKKMILYTLPILLTSILSMLFTTADLLTVSRLGEGAYSMAAIGTNNAPINLLTGFFLGLGTGANVVAANAKGSGDKIRAFRCTQSSLVLAVIAGIFIAVLGLFVARPLLELMKCDPILIDKASLYLKIYLLGSPIMLVYNFGAAILRAYGDSRRPLIALAVAGVVNVGLNLLFVVVFKMDVMGVAIATISSQLVGAGAVIYFLKTDKHIFVNLKFSKLKLYPEETREILKLGLSAGLQSALFNITNVIIQASINTFGPAATAGSTASSTIEGYQYFVLNSIGVATMAFVAQNNGARKKENILKILKYSLLMQFIGTTVVGLFIFFLREPLVGFFIESGEADQQQAIYYGCQRILVISLTYFLCGFEESLSAYYRGLKYSLFPTLVCLFSIVVFRLIFIFTIFQLPEFHTLFWLFMTYPISWILCCILFIIPIKKKSRKVFDTYSDPIIFAKDHRKKDVEVA